MMNNTRATILKRCNDYKRHLKETAKYLSTERLITLHAADIVTSCKKIYTTLSGQHEYWNVGITPAWIIPINSDSVCGCPGKSRLAISGHVNLKEELQIVQSVSVSILFTPRDPHVENNGYSAGPLIQDQSVVVRHFHFDYDSTLPANDRPRTHLQYGGKDPSEYLNGKHRYWLFKSLQLPRIPSPPFDIVLTLNMFLSQFDTPLNPMAEDKKWKSLVKNSEELWLKGYYEQLHNHLQSRNKTKTTLYERQCQHVDWYQ